jgi:hypothetical protein
MIIDEMMQELYHVKEFLLFGKNLDGDDFDITFYISELTDNELFSSDYWSKSDGVNSLQGCKCFVYSHPVTSEHESIDPYRVEVKFNHMHEVIISKIPPLVLDGVKP